MPAGERRRLAIVKEEELRTSRYLRICILNSTFTGLALGLPVRPAWAAPPASAGPARTRAASATRGGALRPVGPLHDPALRIGAERWQDQAALADEGDDLLGREAVAGPH